MFVSWPRPASSASSIRKLAPITSPPSRRISRIVAPAVPPVAITSSSDEKLALMRELGADITVNYKRNPDWGKTIFDATGGVDVVLENVGRPTLDQSMHACGNNARVVMIGTGPLPKQLPAMPGLYMKNIGLVAISNGSRTMLEHMAEAIAANKLRAVIGKTFSFEDAPAAFEFAGRSGHAGKVLIRHG